MRFLPIVALACRCGLAALPALVAPTLSRANRAETDLSGAGWTLWHDAAAPWKDDALHFPAPPLAELPVNPPSGGWGSLHGAGAVAVSVPGTVEEYLQKTPGPDGDLTGVSWWTRSFDVPAVVAGEAPRRVLLRFDSVRERAEVFVNRKLVAYDLVGSTPFEADITAAVKPGATNELSVRVTDPGGNFDWRDSRPMPWGKHQLPLSHGFGGVTGRMRLVVCDPVYVDDVYMQNLPAITEARAQITVRNLTGAPQRRALVVRVVERNAPSREVFRATVNDVTLPPGDTVVPVEISAPTAKRWGLDDPQLHTCEATLLAAGAGADAAALDSDRRDFGFRWFAPEGFGRDALFRLNGRRIVVRSAISWGFWPVNGIFPSAELAERQVRVARAYGLNMLHFHRAIGNPVVFEKADELGLLYFEEPGAYKSVTQDPLGLRLVREKLLRMVRRDRSHPSLVIYNQINEWDSRNPNPNPAEIARHRDDLAAAHALDPSRVALHTSAWARGADIDDPAKLHFRPYDDAAHWNGWYDYHHAGGPAVWNETLYRSPRDYLLRSENAREILFWGEEGAISTPPRIELIERELARAPRLGWDGAGYREWFRTFDEFMTRKQLRPAFASVDAFTAAMGDVSLRHQGRRIENVRLGNVADGYAINGWEAELIENHSGVVDCFRNPKGDPAILAHYNQANYVAVKLRTTIVQPPAELVADCFAINETNLRGPHRLRAVLRDGAGRELARRETAVTLSGGDVFGELLAEAVTLPVPADARGELRVEAALLDDGGAEKSRGHDDAFAVEWRGLAVPEHGAVWESEGAVRRFLAATPAGAAVPEFRDGLPPLRWIVAARGPLEGDAVPVATEYLRTGEGDAAGLRATFYSDREMTKRVHERRDATVALAVDDGASPDPALPVMSEYSVRWTGLLRPPRAGKYGFVLRSTGRVKLSVAGKPVIAQERRPTDALSRGSIELPTAGPVAIELDFQYLRGDAECALSWVTPDAGTATAANVLERVRGDGATLVVLQQADAWMTLLAAQPESPVRYAGAFKVGKAWLGGIHFVREHPLFAGLPVNGAMDWPYQSVVRNGDERLGLRLEGEELAAGCYHSFPMELGSVAGVIRLGRGHVVFSTLDVVPNLNAPDGPAHVARRIFANALTHAAELARPKDR